MTASPDTPSVDDNVDEQADATIAACLNLAAPRSFFLFAGAGSGKTGSLVRALEHLQRTHRDLLISRGQRVSVITYTNAASDEIKRRIKFDPIVDVRTIHSFAWSLIDGLHRDIREWLRTDLSTDIDDLRTKEATGRKGAASEARLNRIERKTKRLQNLDRVKQFTYSPTGDNRSRDALNHHEVLQIAASFLRTKPIMQSILIGRHPIVLIDESQDTNKHIIESLFAVQSAQHTKFILGLFGDTMQRIYNDGKDGLERDLPPGWATPSKELNYRCPRRIVELINNVRSKVDSQQQRARRNAEEGCVRVFVIHSQAPDKPASELAAAARMVDVTGDENWAQAKSIKTLTLEHRMAALRMGFLEMFTPLYGVESWRTSFLEGELPVCRFFTKHVLPLVTAKQSGDRFTLARVAKKLSPLLSAEALQAQDDKKRYLERVSAAIDDLMLLWQAGADPSLGAVLRSVAKNGLLEIPDALIPHIPTDTGPRLVATEEEAELDLERFNAIATLLTAPFSQVPRFELYMSGMGPFDTHQGVKGLEFDRVMVVIDDGDAKGFMFKYDSLFGGKTTGDKTVESTRRLFYVTCSRARESLAIIAYTREPERTRRFLIEEGWFTEEEVISDLA